MAKHTGSVFSVDVTGLETALGQPAYARICDRIRTAITSGALAPNARLPSSRALASDFRVARNTIERAVAAECSRSGIEVHPLSKYGATDRSGLVFGFAGATAATTRSGLQIVRRSIAAVKRL